MKDKVFARLRISLLADITGSCAPVGLKSYLRFVHCGIYPLPEVEDQAPCELRFQFDCFDEAEEPLGSEDHCIYKGTLLYSKGPDKKSPGFYMPLESFESFLPKILEWFIALDEDKWPVANLKKAFGKKAYKASGAVTNWAFSIPLTCDMFLEADRRAVKAGKLVFEHWMIK